MIHFIDLNTTVDGVVTFNVADISTIRKSTKDHLTTITMSNGTAYEVVGNRDEVRDRILRQLPGD